MRVDDLIGVPFFDHGRDPSIGFDCYGFVIYVYKRMGRELPDVDYSSSEAIYVNKNYTDVIESLKDKIKKVDDKQFGDLILFKDSKGRAVHIAVSLERDKFIHCDQFGVRVMRLEYYGKDYEVYRWQE